MKCSCVPFFRTDFVLCAVSYNYVSGFSDHRWDFLHTSNLIILIAQANHGGDRQTMILSCDYP